MAAGNGLCSSVPFIAANDKGNEEGFFDVRFCTLRETQSKVNEHR